MEQEDLEVLKRIENILGQLNSDYKSKLPHLRWVYEEIARLSPSLRDLNIKLNQKKEAA